TVDDIKQGEQRRRPYPPYITSTLQQDASRRLRFTTRKTMAIAQQLYEGIDIGKEGSVGLITYMRTDSTRVSRSSTTEAKDYIISSYGKEFSNGGITYGKKSDKDTQDAHEAIRPTIPLRDPKMIRSYLTKDQKKLYELIWNRFIASQMERAKYDTLNVKILNNDYLFRATGSRLVFPGFLKVYSFSDQNNKDTNIPELKPREKLAAKDIIPNQHFTKPPA